MRRLGLLFCVTMRLCVFTRLRRLHLLEESLLILSYHPHVVILLLRSHLGHGHLLLVPELLGVKLLVVVMVLDLLFLTQIRHGSGRELVHYWLHRHHLGVLEIGGLLFRRAELLGLVKSLELWRLRCESLALIWVLSLLLLD